MCHPYTYNLSSADTPPHPLQVLYFNFNEHPQGMFDRIMGIEVLNAKKMMRDAFIGSFEVILY